MQEQVIPESEQTTIQPQTRMLVTDKQGRFAYGRKLRRIMRAWMRRQARAERRAAHRALRMLRHEEGLPMWRPESNDKLVDTLIAEGFITEDQREEALAELRHG